LEVFARDRMPLSTKLKLAERRKVERICGKAFAALDRSNLVDSMVWTTAKSGPTGCNQAGCGLPLLMGALASPQTDSSLGQLQQVVRGANLRPMSPSGERCLSYRLLEP